MPQEYLVRLACRAPLVRVDQLVAQEPLVPQEAQVLPGLAALQAPRALPERAEPRAQRV